MKAIVLCFCFFYEDNQSVRFDCYICDVVKLNSVLIKNI